MKLPLKAVLVGIDKVLAVAQLIDLAATAIGGLFKKKKRQPKLSELVERRVDRGAKTVVLRRPPPPTNPKD